MVRHAPLLLLGAETDVLRIEGLPSSWSASHPSMSPTLGLNRPSKLRRCPIQTRQRCRTQSIHKWG